jgi:hypothetical protein
MMTKVVGGSGNWIESTKSHAEIRIKSRIITGKMLQYGSRPASKRCL